MGRKQIYANDTEKQKAYVCRKDNISYRLVNGYVITNGDKYQTIMDRMNGNHIVNNKVNIVKTSHPGKEAQDFIRVIDCIHVNVHPSQRKTLKNIVGSFEVAEVRQWLIDRYNQKRA